MSNTPDTDPTPAQIEAGNYRKGHIKYQGLDITIENLKGSKRRGVDSKGKSWGSTLPADYGYIKRTVGADKDHLDVYVGPNKDAFMVWVVNQKDLDTGKFDEHKCMLGFKTKKEAIEIYAKGFNDGKGLRRIISVKSMTIPKFKEWIKEKDNMTKEAQARLERRVYLKGYFDKVAQDAGFNLAQVSGMTDDEIKGALNSILDTGNKGLRRGLAYGQGAMTGTGLVGAGGGALGGLGIASLVNALSNSNEEKKRRRRGLYSALGGVAGGIYGAGPAYLTALKVLSNKGTNKLKDAIKNAPTVNQ